ncbi:hypothetical protein LMG22931_01308 [Paraburkholderia nemoris]|nr:hypothetical protein LMG22931_01308 [Paraburkholderia nemoris]
MDSYRRLGDSDELARRHPGHQTTQLKTRPSLLAPAQAGSRTDLLQAIADAALSLCSAGSVGISARRRPLHILFTEPRDE